MRPPGFDARQGGWTRKGRNDGRRERQDQEHHKWIVVRSIVRKHTPGAIDHRVKEHRDEDALARVHEEPDHDDP